jgi:hypothetical protein
MPISSRGVALQDAPLQGGAPDPTPAQDAEPPMSPLLVNDCRSGARSGRDDHAGDRVQSFQAKKK